MTDKAQTTSRTVAIVIVYPFILLIIATALNFLVSGVHSAEVSLPTTENIFCLAVSAAFLVGNHSWLMTTTALTRSKFGIVNTPEEWERSGARLEDASADGVREVERRLNTHRNTTENTIYFVLLAPIFILVSPPFLAVLVWTVGFAVSRLGYSYGFLFGKDGLRYVFMSLGLLAIYGMVSYLLVSLVI